MCNWKIVLSDKTIGSNLKQSHLEAANQMCTEQFRRQSGQLFLICFSSAMIFR